MTLSTGSIPSLKAAASLAAFAVAAAVSLAQTPAAPPADSSSLSDAPTPNRSLPPSLLRPGASSTAGVYVTVLEDTLIRVRTMAPINSKQADENARFSFTVSEDVKVGELLAIPRGATVHGGVVKSKKAGVLTGSPELILKLDSLDLGGKTYPLYTHHFKVTGTSKTPATETKALTGAYVGALAGSFGVSQKSGVQTSSGTGRAAGMATGAAVGAGVGTAISAATPGPGIWIPSESEIDFFLAAPVAILPLSAKETARLSEGLNHGGPVLYVRGETP